MFDQYVLNVKLLGYLINLLQDAKQGPAINVSVSLLNMQICSVRLIFGLIGVRFDSRYAYIALFSSSKLW